MNTDMGSATDSNTAQPLFNTSSVDFNGHEVASNVVLYSFPFIIVIGTVCNLLTFLVMRKKRTSPIYFHMGLLAWVDNLVLLVGCLNTWLRLTRLQWHIYAVNWFFCKVFSMLLYATMDYSVWLVVAMTVERFIVVVFPLKASQICTMRNAKLAAVWLLVSILLVNSHFLVTHTRQATPDDPSRFDCIEYATAGTRFFMTKMWPLIDATVYSFLPSTIIIVCNTLIVYNLVKASRDIKLMNENKATIHNSSTSDETNSLLKQQQQHQVSSNAPQSSGGNTNKRLTMLLLLVSISFVVTSTPIVALQLIENFSDSINTQEMPNWRKVKSLCLVLQYSNHAINFFLYAITGKAFRSEFLSLFRGGCGSWLPISTPSTVTTSTVLQQQQQGKHQNSLKQHQQQQRRLP